MERSSCDFSVGGGFSLSNFSVLYLPVPASMGLWRIVSAMILSVIKVGSVVLRNCILRTVSSCALPRVIAFAIFDVETQDGARRR